MNLRLRLLWLPLFAALLHAASLPGWVFPPLALLAVVPRIAFWERGGPWWGDALGGFFFWTLAFAFIRHTSWMMPPAAAACLWPWWVAARFLHFRLRRRLGPGLSGALAVAATEYLRMLWPMQGVPWASLGLGFANLPGGLFLARAVGESGLAVLAALTGGWLYAFARRRRRREFALAPGLWAAAVAAAAVSPPPAPPGGTVRCLAVQPNLTLDEKVEMASADAIFDNQIGLMREAWEAGERPELVLWAETMYPYMMVAQDVQGEVRRPLRGRDEMFVRSAPAALSFQYQTILMIMRWVRPGGFFITGSHLWQGLPPDAPPGEPSPRTTGMLAFDERADLAAYREKSRLVPFGETLPFDGRLPFSRQIAQWIFDAFGLHPLIQRVPPEGPLRLPRAGGPDWVLGSAVCWENPFPSIFRRQASQGAQAFCISSNEAWFGTGAEMEQMLASTRFRAVETGRAVLRVTNTGLTGLVDAWGAPRDFLARGIRGWLAVDLPLRREAEATVFLAGGWLLQPLAAWLALAAVVWTYLPRRRRVDRFRGQG